MANVWEIGTLLLEGRRLEQFSWRELTVTINMLIVHDPRLYDLTFIIYTTEILAWLLKDILCNYVYQSTYLKANKYVKA